MSRRHLFAVVVLLGAAVVAGLLAVTRTTTAATPASSDQVVFESRSLDQLEASLRRALAEQPPLMPETAHTTAETWGGTVVAHHEDVDDDGDDDEHEDRHEDADD